MIYTVTLNPSLDYVTHVNNFEAGKINKVRKEAMYPGGKGVNVSVMLNNLDVRSIALGFVAGFTGEEFKKRMAAKGLKTDFIKVKEGLTRINVKVKSDTETEINAGGPVITFEDLEKLYKKLEVLNSGDILVLAGNVPDSVPKSIYKDIAKMLEEKNVEIVVDATGSALRETLPLHPFLIKPNDHELGDLFGIEITTKAEAITYAKKLREEGAKNVMVSMAGEGAVLVTEDGEAYSLSAPKGILKNSVGAGDSAVAGFIAGYIKNKDYIEAFKLAVCSGSASAFSEDLAEGDFVRTLYEDFFVDTEVKKH